MRILKYCYEFPPIGGGGAYVVEGLARELVAKGHQVDLVTMAFNDLPSHEVVGGVNVYRVPCLRRRASICHPYEMATYLVGALPVIRRLSRETRYDINHTHFIFPDALLAYSTSRSTGLPYIVTAHGSDVPGYNPNRFKFAHRLLTPLWARVVSGAQEIISPSHSLSRLINLQNPATPVRVIPNGIQISSCDLSYRDPLRILVVTRFFERKGIQYLLYALDGMRMPFKVDIVGEGPHMGVLTEIASTIDTDAEITFHGWVDNKSALFKRLFEQATLFVFPSETENFPMVLLEAMMAELAIITTRDTGCEEVVEDTALLVPPKDPVAIRKAIERLVCDPDLSRSLSKKARQRVEEKFAWPVVADQYIDTYQRVLRDQ
jgi:glycosyltransferase involved in cell wall biosynthesis